MDFVHPQYEDSYFYIYLVDVGLGEQKFILKC